MDFPAKMAFLPNHLEFLSIPDNTSKLLQEMGLDQVEY